MENILVTGGAGYIGSITVEQFKKRNINVIVIDNFQEGNKKAISDGVILFEGNYGDKDILNKIFKENNIEAVIHFAADASVPLSMKNPSRFFRNNVINGINLLDIILKYNCEKFIFSSSAAMFGEPKYTPIDEKHPTNPINPYGESKLMFEKILEWYHKAYGLKFNSFRYFNAAGASEKLGEAHKHESHLIPLIIKCALGQSKEIKIFGNDYDTKDGTCIRDYIHVIDLAEAHILALENLDTNPTGKYNLGNGKGFTNLEVVEMVKKLSGKNFRVEITNRRAGDPAVLIASSKLAENELGWKPKYNTLEKIVQSAWEWHKKYPNGYDD